MRIIRGHDYYDGVLAYGQDRDVVFVRDGLNLVDKDEVKTYFEGMDAKILYPVRYGLNDIFRTSRKKDFLINSGVIYVAGRRYPIITAREMYVVSNERLIFFDKKSFEEFAQQNDIMVSYNTSSWDNRALWVQHIEDNHVPNDVKDFLVRKRITVLTGEYGRDDQVRWTVNGDNLKSFQFQRVLDPYSCAQEISMWVGGVLPKNGNPMVEITDDKIKIAKHGMDKWSFRKQKNS